MSAAGFGIALCSDCWNGVECVESVLRNPGIGDLTAAIDALDADVRTLVVVSGPGESHLAVGGGKGQFVVYATFDNLTFFNLVHPGAGQGILAVVAGGQAGEYPAEQVVGRAEALAAATRFLVDGRLGEDLGWRRQA